MKSKLFIVLVFCVHSKVIYAKSEIPKNQTFILAIGSSKVLPVTKGSSVWIENSKVLVASAVRSSVEIKGKQKGSSRVKIGSSSYLLEVLNPPDFEFFSNLGAIFKEIIGPEVKVSQGNVIVTGQLYSMTDLERIRSAYVPKSKFINQLKMKSEIRDSFKREVARILDAEKYSPHNLSFGESIETATNLKGQDFNKLEDILNPFGIRLTMDESSISLAPLVKVEITVAEVKRSSKTHLGIKWASNAMIQPVAGKWLANVSTDGLGTFLEENGYGKVLASPSLLCRTGKEAEFLAGGEFPMKLVGNKRMEVVWKKYGVLLKVKPIADRLGHMSIGIETEVSSLDHSQTIDGMPGLFTNRISSHFDLSRPQTIALSGLIKNEEGVNSEGIPLLSRIPILGALFSSKEFVDNRSELIIFVRPSIQKEGDYVAKKVLNSEIDQFSQQRHLLGKTYE